MSNYHLEFEIRINGRTLLLKISRRLMSGVKNNVYSLLWNNESHPIF